MEVVHWQYAMFENNSQILILMSFILIKMLAAVSMKISLVGPISPSYPYSIQSCLFVSESIKFFAFSLLSVINLSSLQNLYVGFTNALSNIQSSSIILVIISATRNTLVFCLFQYMDPVSIMLLELTSFIFQATIFSIIYSPSISATRSMILVSHLCGVVVMQYNTCMKSLQYRGSAYAALTAEVLLSLAMNLIHHKARKKRLSIDRNAPTSSLSSEMSESEQFYDHRFELEAICSGLGAVFHLVGYAVIRRIDFIYDRKLHPGFFHMLDSLWPSLVVLCNASLGLIIYSIHRADVDEFLHVAFTCVMNAVFVTISAKLLMTRWDLHFVLGTALIISSTILYFSISLKEDELEKLKK